MAIKEPRNLEIKIKVTASEKQNILDNAQKQNMTISAFCRQQALHPDSSTSLPQKKADLYNHMQHMIITYASEPNIQKMNNRINKKSNFR